MIIVHMLLLTVVEDAEDIFLVVGDAVCLEYFFLHAAEIRQHFCMRIIIKKPTTFHLVWNSRLCLKLV